MVTGRDPIGILREQRRIGLVPLGALPSRRLEVLRAQFLGAWMEGAGAQGPVAQPLLTGMGDPVDLRESLGGPRVHVRRGARRWWESRRVGSVGIELAVSEIGRASCRGRGEIASDAG